MLRPYPEAQGCDAKLNDWCDDHCPHREAHGPLLARMDYAGARDRKAWRCYALSTLSEDGQSYVGGDTYCTRHMPLSEVLERCLRDGASGQAPAGATRARYPAAPPLSASSSTGRASLPERAERTSSPGPQAAARGQVSLRTPQYRVAPPVSSTPHYVHNAAYMTLPKGVRVPLLEECAPNLVEGAAFWAASMFTSGYAPKAKRLVASCEAWGICCGASLVPDGALLDDEREGSFRLRHRLIATKPLFILSTLLLSPLPLAWLDVDLEFHAFPTLFTRSGWLDHQSPPRDVLLWNWQANVSAFNGRRLKMASGVAWFNKTEPAQLLLTAWAEAMAFEPNQNAPDDQTMDLLVNDDGWIDRCAFGWLPESYLRMMPRHRDISPVIDHDRGAPVSGKGRNSPIEPVLPPRETQRAGRDEL